MNNNQNNRFILTLMAIGVTLYFLVSYFWFERLMDLFNFSLGLMIVISVFYEKAKKINYLMALFGVNILQWLFLIFIFFNNLIYVKTDLYYYLIVALLITLILANKIRKNHFKSSEYGQDAKFDVSNDINKLMLLILGMVIIIGSLACFVTYYAPIFLYGVTLGLMTFIYGFYRENRKVNILPNYFRTMFAVLILQWIINLQFWHQFSKDDFVFAFTVSLNITIFFSMQIYKSDLKFLEVI